MSFVTRLRSSGVLRPLSVASRTQLRCYSCTTPRQSQETSTALKDTTPLDSRWFSNLQTRIEKLRSSKYPPECVSQAEKLYQHTTSDWIELLAGREGFLTDKSWRALDHYPLLWGDMDSMRFRFKVHLLYADCSRPHDAATEEQRRQWDDLPTPRSLGLILRRITTEFKLPLTFPDHVTVLYRLSERPRYDSTSLLMEGWILSDQHRRLAAKCIDDTAIYDYTTSKRSVLKPFMVEKFQETFDRQMESQIKCDKDARDVIAAVEGLEKQFQ
ncbi:hypothetical protein LCI18_002945 [Fusarium solani-melongenae]|uniref:Uncharacterized protein n=1 Tax=Fusarium solani subsp. cucurbitae TaxID=2747967 RepID=A0ACD3YST9_FUSSC|nr:hypothetical protein LCI18_002945 [Fusarium solani-melongenae]